LGSVVTDTGGSERDIIKRVGKAKSVFGFWKTWEYLKEQKARTKTKIRLYEALVLSAPRYGAETWNMRVLSTKRMEAAHRK